MLASLPLPYAADIHKIKSTGEKAVALLHLSVVKVAGSFPIRLQTIGDCVSQGCACAVDVVKCVEIDLLGENEAWIAETATEPIYAGSRVEIGGGKIRGDGSVGAWAAKFVTVFGAIPRGVYGTIDLTSYSGDRAKQWGRGSNGVPDTLEPSLRRHPVKAATLVKSYEEARDMLASGYPIPVCSNRGFANKRDAEGFARPKGSWSHCMAFIACDDAHTRPGLLCMNSWGPDWISGPKRHDQPEGSFWVDAEVATKMLRQGDSFALSGYEGFPRQQIDWTLA